MEEEKERERQTKWKKKPIYMHTLHDDEDDLQS